MLKYIKTSTRVGYASPIWGRAQVQEQKESRITIRGDEVRALSPLRRLGNVVPTVLLVRLQCSGKDLYKAVAGHNTKPIVLSMITGSYLRRRRRLTIFESDETKFTAPLTLLSF